MSYDYYTEAKKIAAILQEEGLSYWATQIISAMEEGATATEILMMLRWRLENFLASQSGSTNVIAYTELLHQKIDTALNP